MKGATAGELVGTEFEEKTPILHPWLNTGELVLLFAPRGTGKTYVSLALASALSVGEPFLGWVNNRKWKTYYIDGEMGRRNLATRLKQIAGREQSKFANAWLRLFTFENCENETMWNMSMPGDQMKYSELIKDAEVVIIDNLLSCSTPVDGRDDDLRQWQRLQPWLVKLRAEGKTVILIHHAGKSGEQLGTSARENIVDTIISLKDSKLEQPDHGQAFELYYEKTRNFYGKDKKPLFVEYTMHEDALYWRTEDIDITRTKAVMKQAQYTPQAHLLAAKFNMPLFQVIDILQKHDLNQIDEENNDDLFQEGW